MVWHQPVPVFRFLTDPTFASDISFGWSVHLKIIFYSYSIHLYISRIWTRIMCLAHNRSPTNVKLKWQVHGFNKLPRSCLCVLNRLSFLYLNLHFSLILTLFVGILGFPLPVSVLSVIPGSGVLLCPHDTWYTLQPPHCPRSVDLSLKIPSWSLNIFVIPRDSQTTSKSDNLLIYCRVIVQRHLEF